MGNSQTKDKLTKRERLDVLFKIDRTFDSFCHACPYFAQNTPHRNCKQCPIDIQLQEYGKTLGWDVDSDKTNKRGSWSIEEDSYIRNSFGKKPVTKIAEKLGRNHLSVTKRITRLREEGLL